VAQLRQFEALAGLEPDVEALTLQLAAERPWRALASLEPHLTRIRDRYREVRRHLLNKQNAEAEAARARVKTRAGFELLTPDESHRVLRPIAEAQVDTTPDAIAPTLTEVQGRFSGRILQAEEQANERLDEVISTKNQKPVVKVDPQLKGREVANREQLRALFRELEDRIGPQLDQGIRVRLG
jgi:hypothetical protein